MDLVGDSTRLKPWSSSGAVAGCCAAGVLADLLLALEEGWQPGL
jgi:hypothetical protein